MTALGAVCGLFSGCKEEKEPDEPFIVPTEDEKFELAVRNGLFDDLTPFVNSYLATLGAETDEAAMLDSLAEWLQKKPLVDTVTAVCHACVKTVPEQSAMIVDFIVDDVLSSYLLDVVMETPLRVNGWHKTVIQPYGELTLHEWKLKDFTATDFSPNVNYPDDVEPYIVKFNQNGTVNFLFSCNLPRADFIQCEDGRILFFGSLFRQKRMMCDWFPVNENVITDNLSRATFLSLSDEELTINSATNGLMHFVK